MKTGRCGAVLIRPGRKSANNACNSSTHFDREVRLSLTRRFIDILITCKFSADVKYDENARESKKLYERLRCVVKTQTR